ncbi:hypothetical protein HMI54_000928 [Coelomomyces lativittatus]|nr:hypothetical protein HMI54_000928 [Coelomomyces lativittatus]
MKHEKKKERRNNEWGVFFGGGSKTTPSSSPSTPHSTNIHLNHTMPTTTVTSWGTSNTTPPPLFPLPSYVSNTPSSSPYFLPTPYPSSSSSLSSSSSSSMSTSSSTLIPSPSNMHTVPFHFVGHETLHNEQPPRKRKRKPHLQNSERVAPPPSTSLPPPPTFSPIKLNTSTKEKETLALGLKNRKKKKKKDPPLLSSSTSMTSSPTQEKRNMDVGPSTSLETPRFSISSTSSSSSSSWSSTVSNGGASTLAKYKKEMESQRRFDIKQQLKLLQQFI